MKSDTKYYLITVLATASLIGSGIYYYNMVQKEKCERERLQGIQTSQCKNHYSHYHGSYFRGTSAFSNNKTSTEASGATNNSKSSGTVSRGGFGSFGHSFSVHS